MEDPIGMGLTMIMLLLVVWAAASTPTIIEGIAVRFEELSDIKEVGTKHGFFD